MVPMAVGADQEPSARRATTTPEPNRAVPRKPALKTVRIARPWGGICQHIVLYSTSVVQLLKHAGCGESMSYLCVGKNIWRDDLIRSERLLRIYEGCQNLSRLSTFAWREQQLSATSPDSSPHENMACLLLTGHGRGQRVVEREAHLAASLGGIN
jgi:hypothetical protein